MSDGLSSRSLHRVLALAFVATLSAVFLLLTACSSSPPRDPAPLVPIAETSRFGQAWQSSVGGTVQFPLQTGLAKQNIIVFANSRGDVVALNAQSGAQTWRFKLNAELSSGVGFDGQIAAVTTVQNELIVMRAGQAASQGTGAGTGSVLWRKVLQARTYTAPLVAGGRVFILAADRTVQAFDAITGASLWQLQRPSEPLVLSQLGTLGSYQNTLLVGHAGRLLGVNPDNAQVLWELTVATSRATNDIERLIDLVGAPSRVGDSVCLRSYQTSVSCVDMTKGALAWTKPAQGATGVSGDAQVLVGTESDGRVKAWSRTSGEVLWSSDKLVYRGLSAPLVIGNSVVIGDAQGYVHVMNKTTGELTARLTTDGGAIAAAPVASDATVVVATAKGGIYAFTPK